LAGLYFIPPEAHLEKSLKGRYFNRIHFTLIKKKEQCNLIAIFLHQGNSQILYGR
jgi:hypothetical protein